MLGMENIINHNNPGPIIGNITSPLFGQANQPAGARDLGGGGFSEAANNRRLELQIRPFDLAALVRETGHILLEGAPADLALRPIRAT